MPRAAFLNGLTPLVMLTLLVSGCTFLPQGRDKTAPAPARQARIAPQPEARQCLAQLGDQAAGFAALPDQILAGGCSKRNAVNLTHLRSDNGRIGVTNLGATACPTASAFAAWARYGVDRAARQILGSRLAQIETFGSFACRNVAGTSRLSAHGTADAIDVSGFVLADGRRITLLQDWNGGTEPERRFLRAVHASACKRFGTVLGPQYNAAHRDHFHLEKGGSSGFCR